MFPFFFSFFLQSLSIQANPIPEYRAAIVSTMSSPLLIAKKNGFEGVMQDYFKALEEELGISIKVELLPRLRIDNIKEEKYDLNCYTSYAWNYKREEFYWSKAIFHKREIVIGTTALPYSINDFKGQKIGTTRGYKYPALEKLFAEKKLIREDAEDEETNLIKLVNGRINYAVTDELLFQYFKKNHPVGKNKILKESLLEAEYPIQCALNKESKIKIEKLNKAINAIISSGKLNRIFSKYK